MRLSGCYDIFDNGENKSTKIILMNTRSYGSIIYYYDEFCMILHLNICSNNIFKLINVIIKGISCRIL